MKTIRNNHILLDLFAGTLLIAMVLTAYIPAMDNGFVWDDDNHITQNYLLKTTDGLKKIWFEPGSHAQYYPLVLSSFWVQYQLWGLKPFGYHFINIIIHALNAVLLWLILRKLSIPGSLLAACIFALHPVHVESVAWASEHKNVLSGFFYLSSLLTYVYFRFQNTGMQNHYQKNFALYFLALILFLCALFSKTITCSLPAVILLILWWKCERIVWSDILYMVPFFIFGFMLALTTVWMEKHVVGASGPTWDLTYLERVLSAGKALWFYVSKLIYPDKFTFIYPKWGINTNIWWEYLFPLGCIAALFLLWITRNTIGKGPLVAILIFGGTLFPALGFFNLYPMRYSYVADHFQYLASISIIVLFSAGLTRLLDRYKLFSNAHTIKMIIYSMILILLGSMAWYESYKYKNPETLWRDTIEKNDKAALAHLNLANILNKRRALDEAIKHASLAIEIDPSLYEAYNSLGNALLRKREYKDALINYAKAIRIGEARHINTSTFHFNMGNALVEMNKINEGIIHYKNAIAIKPGYANAYCNLGIALLKMGKYNEAIKHFTEAIRIDPALHQPYANMGVALFRTGHVDESITYFKKALQKKPDYVTARQNLQKVMQLKAVKK
jgi:protein O-mannosyl-transferase